MEQENISYRILSMQGFKCFYMWLVSIVGTIGVITWLAIVVRGYDWAFDIMPPMDKKIARK